VLSYHLRVCVCCTLTAGLCAHLFAQVSSTDTLYTNTHCLHYCTASHWHCSNGTATQQAAAVRAQQLTLSSAEGDCIAADKATQVQNTAAFVSTSSSALAAMRNISLNATLAGSGIQGLAAANASFAPPASSGGYK
jgi:hypothetical protein